MRSLLSPSFVLLLLAFLSGTGTEAWAYQSMPAVRPTAVARQLEKEEEKLRDVFDRELNEGRVQPEDWDERRMVVVRQAARLLSGLKIEDWQGDELRTLARLYYFAEDYERAVAADRRFLTQPNPQGRQEEPYRLEARFRLVNSLLELEQMNDAETAFRELEKEDAIGPDALAAQVFILSQFADLYARSNQFDRAVRKALAGYDVSRRIIMFPPGIAESVRAGLDRSPSREAVAECPDKSPNPASVCGSRSIEIGASARPRRRTGSPRPDR